MNSFFIMTSIILPCQKDAKPKASKSNGTSQDIPGAPSLESLIARINDNSRRRGFVGGVWRERD